MVGHGMAATRLVEELVRAGAGYDITVVGDEPYPGYNRILLSAVVEETHQDDDVRLRNTRWYADHGVRLASGRRALELDRASRTLRLDDGSVLGYDRLVLATGSRPLIPPIRGVVTPDGLHQDVHAFRSLDDCHRLRRRAAAARRARGPRLQDPPPMQHELLCSHAFSFPRVRQRSLHIVRGTASVCSSCGAFPTRARAGSTAAGEARARGE